MGVCPRRCESICSGSGLPWWWVMMLFKISPVKKNRCKFAEESCGACCSLQFKMVEFCWSWEGVFFSLLKDRKRLHVKGYLSWNTDFVRISALRLLLKKLYCTAVVAVTNSQQWMQLARAAVDLYRYRILQAPWFSAWMVGRLLFPGGLDGAVLKTKYLGKVTSPSLEISMVPSDRGIAF